MDWYFTSLDQVYLDHNWPKLLLVSNISGLRVLGQVVDVGSQCLQACSQLNRIPFQMKSAQSLQGPTEKRTPRERQPVQTKPTSKQTSESSSKGSQVVFPHLSRITPSGFWNILAINLGPKLPVVHWPQHRFHVDHMPLVSQLRAKTSRSPKRRCFFSGSKKKWTSPKVSKSHGSFLQFNQKLFTFPPKTKQTTAFPECLRFPSLGFGLR